MQVVGTVELKELGGSGLAPHARRIAVFLALGPTEKHSSPSPLPTTVLSRPGSSELISPSNRTVRGRHIPSPAPPGSNAGPLATSPARPSATSPGAGSRGSFPQNNVAALRAFPTHANPGSGVRTLVFASPDQRPLFDQPHNKDAPSVVREGVRPCLKSCNAPCRNRTYNLMIKSHLLCQLS